MLRGPERLENAGWWERSKHARGKRAIERQLDYQTHKAGAIRGHEDEFRHISFIRAQQVRARLEKVGPITAGDKILEVGSGAHGLVFNFPGSFSVGVDPLADHYRKLFPTFQGDTPTVSSIGEELPFADQTFEIVLSDNVIDHAERPLMILDEIVRVLKPGGRLFFTVNIHHPIYSVASEFHGLWNAVGIPLELSAFADHTVHLTLERITRAFQGLPLKVIEQKSTVSETRAAQRLERGLHPEALLRRFFFKNAVFELLALKPE